MNRKERVLAALNNRETDRPPVGFWFHFPLEESLGQLCIDAHLNYYNNIDTDIAKLMCDGYFDYPNPVAMYNPVICDALGVTVPADYVALDVE